MVRLTHKTVLWRYIPMLASLLVFIFHGSTSLHAAEHLFKTYASKQNIELGKSFYLTLSTNRTDISLKQIKLAMLHQNFEVQDNDDLETSDTAQQWKLRLYPRKTGQHTIPALLFAGQKSRPLTIHVNPPVDVKTKKQFYVTSNISTSTPWIKQQLIISYSLETNHDLVVLESPIEKQAGYIIKPLKTTTQQQSEHVFKHTAGWLIYPLIKGLQTIKLPVMNYVRDGVVTHRFYPAPVKLKIKPLPHYLPSNIPVGRITISDLKITGALIFKQKLNTLEVKLIGHGFPAQLLPDLTYQFTSNHQLRFYPGEKQTTRRSDQHGLVSEHRYLIPFKSMVQGKIELPPIRLQYFDPASSTVKTIYANKNNLYSITQWVIILSLLLLGILIIYLYNKARHWITPVWHCYRGYQMTIKNIPESATPHQLKQNLMLIANAEGWPDNMTLQQWQYRWHKRHAKLGGLEMGSLEQSLYRGGELNIEQLKQQTIQLCIKRWPLLMWPLLR